MQFSSEKKSKWQSQDMPPLSYPCHRHQARSRTRTLTHTQTHVKGGVKKFYYCLFHLLLGLLLVCSQRLLPTTSGLLPAK